MKRKVKRPAKIGNIPRSVIAAAVKKVKEAREKKLRRKNEK